MKKFLLLFPTILLLSCRTQYVPLPEQHSRDSTHVSLQLSADSVFQDHYHAESLRRSAVDAGTTNCCDTIIVYDSVFVEKWHYRSGRDTIRFICHDSIPYPVNVPVEVKTPVPRFYTCSTLLFWSTIALLLLAGVLKMLYRK